jgi:hypothetical protein
MPNAKLFLEKENLGKSAGNSEGIFLEKSYN